VAAATAQVDGLGAQHVVHHGVDGRALGQDDVLRQVAVVIPDITLIAGTLRDNLAVGDASAGEKQLMHLAHTWGLLSVGTPSLDAPVDARAWPPDALLRLAAARASLSRPAVIVLYDPFTAAASAPTLSADAVRVLGDGRTVIRVSNREEVLGEADFVVRIAS
jgi:ABC-type multidrug transport system fused ATPase/permease subunit